MVICRSAAVEACELLCATLRTVVSQLLVSELSHLEYITQSRQSVWSNTSRICGLVVGIRRLGKNSSRGLRT